MSSVYTTDGLVIRTSSVGENDKILTLLTPNQGKISVTVKGGRSLKSGSLSSTQLFAYGNYEISSRGDFKWLRGASLNCAFGKLSTDIVKISLASYIASLADELSGENESAEDILRLTLNTFYAIENEIKPNEIIKAVFELRAAAMSGFEPDLSDCRGCGKKDGDDFYIDVMNGRLLCSECMHKRSLQAAKEQMKSEDMREAVLMLPVTQGALTAMRYAISSPTQKMLSFNISDTDEKIFAHAAEVYLLSHLGQGFDTLEFYKTII